MISLLSFLNKCPFLGGRQTTLHRCRSKKSVTYFSFKKHVCEHVSNNRVFAYCFKSLQRYSQNRHFINVRILEGKNVTDYNNIAYIQPIYAVAFNIYRKLSFGINVHI